MPPLPGFTSNPLRTRDDLVRAAAALIAPLDPHKSRDKARIRFPFQTAAAFDEVSAQLEGFARPLFAVAPLLLNDRHTLDGSASSSSAPLGLSSWIEGLAAGVDPQSPEYWGEIGHVDQRMVETESIALALLLVPDAFLAGMDGAAKANVAAWLRGIRGKRMPANNWRWFRVFANLALVRVFGVPADEVRGELDSDLALLDSFYLGEGWSSDGLWGEERSQADYYSGSFAMQFAQLLFVRFADEGEHGERIDRYKAQAREFGAKFWRFFDCDGAAIPFGRSMTYRFAFAAFWAAAALAKVDLGPTLTPGAVKGLLLRHLRWWADEERADMFHADGTLTIGFTYPNMYLAEDYNSPQSPYWCLKPFVVLALTESDEFWAVEEEDYPGASTAAAAAAAAAAEHGAPRVTATVVWPPRQIVVNDPSHHYLLSSGQSTTKAFKAREAKYGKFAYSSAFGFSVPAGPLLHQVAPDNTLAISFGHEDSWRTRSSPRDVRLKDIAVEGRGTGVAGLTSTWKPQSHLRNLEIKTTLIPPIESHPGWHVRVHVVTGAASRDTERISLVEGGFAVASCGRDGRFVPELSGGGLHHDGWSVRGKDGSGGDDGGSALVSSWAGTSGIVDLTGSLSVQVHEGPLSMATTRTITNVMRPDPNTNLLASRTMMPFVRHDLELSSHGGGEKVFATAVFAVKASEGLGRDEVWEMWRKTPQIQVDREGGLKIVVSGV